MLWAKEKYEVKINRGGGEFRTPGLHGLIQQMVISPKNEETIWSMKVLDRDDDIIFQIKDHEGQLNDRDGIPVGKDKPESLRFIFDELTANEPMQVLLNIKEIK